MDRNALMLRYINRVKQSLSARRAWIEIAPCALLLAAPGIVALRKESVDRNLLDH